MATIFSSSGRIETVHIPIQDFRVDGELNIPSHAMGLVIFAHGSGSSRFSPRNQLVAKRLQAASVATLLVDLLSEEEDADYRNRFDIARLTERLLAITDWARLNDDTQDLTLGYFGASTGAAAALSAAAAVKEDVPLRAIVSRGGRVDLAGGAVATLEVPTLLIVGQRDEDVLEANEKVFLALKGKKELAVIPEATHLFEEPGALEHVAELATRWFTTYL